MSSKARRMPNGTLIERYDWKSRTPSTPSFSAASIPIASIAPAPFPAPAPHTQPVPAPIESSDHFAAIERDAFTQGYAQGERAGAEGATTRAEAMLRRLARTLEELAALREDMLRRTERQMVQLALAIANRIVGREVTTDRALLVAMARVALDRLAEHQSATIRLNPEDYALVGALKDQDLADRSATIEIVADPAVSRGGCLVQSDVGFMDVSPEAQFHELARTLLDGGDNGDSQSGHRGGR